MRFTLQIIALAVAVQTGFGAAATIFGDRVLAKGKDFEIKASQVEETFIAYKAARAGAGQPAPQGAVEIAKVEGEILDQLIASKLILARANEADRTNAVVEATKLIEEKKSKAPSEGAFRRQLAIAGLTMEQFANEVRDQAIAKAVIDRELRSKQTVTDEEIEKVYKENLKRFEEPEKWKVAHVYLGNRDRATHELISEAEKKVKIERMNDILRKARRGDDFVMLVKENSEHLSSKETNGESTFSRGQMPPEFESAGTTLKPGQISEVVQSGIGWHIIKFIEHIPAKTAEFSEVKDRIRDTLLRDATQKALPDWVKDLRKEAGVEITAGK